MATYSISDLHGQYDIFEKLLDIIHFSDDDFLYVLGGAIDRGPDGVKILQTIMNAPNMDLLIGNHEFLMLNAIAQDGSVDELPGRDVSLWLDFNGGQITYDHYCELSLEERKSLLAWLKTRAFTTLVSIGVKTFCLTHSYFKVALIDTAFSEVSYRVAWNIVWRTPYRDDIYVPTDDYVENDWQFIIGHVPVQRVVGLDTKLEAFHDQNILLFDGGCSYRNDGVLNDDEYGVICIKLDDLSETVLTFASL